MLTPLITAALLYVLGAASASAFRIPVLAAALFLFASFAATLVSFRFRRSLLTVFLALDVVFAGACLQSLAANPVSADHVRKLASPWGMELTGTILQEPDYNKGRYYFLLGAEETRDSLSVNTAGHRAEGLVRVTCPSSARSGVPLLYGRRISVSGLLKEPPAPVKPGAFDYRRYLSNKKIFAVITARKIEDLGRGKENFFLSIAARCRRAIRKSITGTLKGDEAALLRGVMLGDRVGLSQELKEMFIATGLAHTLVVSGLHVGLVASIFFLFFHKLLRLPRKIVSFITMPFTVLYCLMTGANAPVVRATVITLVVLMGYVLEREPDMLNNLALAALIILVINPLSLFDASFQLSFLATLGIVYLVPFFDANFKKVLPGWFATPFAVSVSAQIGVAPLIAYYFNKISIVALVANIFVVPIMGAVLALGMLTAIFSFFSQALAKLAAALNYALLWYFAAAVKFFGSFMFASLNVPKPAPVFIAGYYAAMFAPGFKHGKWVFMGLWAALAIYVWIQVFI